MNQRLRRESRIVSDPHSEGVSTQPRGEVESKIAEAVGLGHLELSRKEATQSASGVARQATTPMTAALRMTLTGTRSSQERRLLLPGPMTVTEAGAETKVEGVRTGMGIGSPIATLPIAATTTVVDQEEENQDLKSG